MNGNPEHIFHCSVFRVSFRSPFPRRLPEADMFHNMHCHQLQRPSDCGKALISVPPHLGELLIVNPGIVHELCQFSRCLLTIIRKTCQFKCDRTACSYLHYLAMTHSHRINDSSPEPCLKGSRMLQLHEMLQDTPKLDVPSLNSCRSRQLPRTPCSLP